MVSSLKRFLSRWRRLLIGLGLFVVLVPLGLAALLRIDSVRERSRVVQLTNIDQLKAAFNDDVGSARMIVLLSPT